MKTMYNKRGIFGILAILIAIIISFYFDSYIVYYMSLIRIEILNDLFLGLTSWSFVVITMFILPSIMLWQIKQKSYIFPLWVSGFIAGVVSYIVKIIVQRPRPFNLGIVATFPTLAKNSYLAWDSSFVSSHAMLAFCILPFLTRKFPKLKYLWIILAILIAFSRVYFGLHFLSDILAGGLIGYAIGWIVLKIEEDHQLLNSLSKKVNKFFKKLIQIKH